MGNQSDRTVVDLVPTHLGSPGIQVVKLVRVWCDRENTVTLRV